MMHQRKVLFLAAALLMTIAGCDDDKKSDDRTEANVADSDVKYINYSVISILPHDTIAFTEGLLFHNGKLYESTGYTDDLPNTRSLFGELNVKTGLIDVKAELDKTKYFGEGIAILKDKIYQLTYKTRKGFVYDAMTFKKIKEFTFSNAEGWGMTNDSSYLVMSDGTNNLTWLDPSNFRVVRTIAVTQDNIPVDNLNELEYVKGVIYANVFMTNDIVRIDPSNGKVTGRMNCDKLKNDQKMKYAGALEMNGIAYNPTTGRFFITGKMWPGLYEIEINQ